MASRIGRAVLELATDHASFESGLLEAEQHLQGINQRSREAAEGVAKFGAEVDNAGQNLSPVNEELTASGEGTRAFLRDLRDAAQVLAGTSALLSVATRGNKELQDTFEKVTVALSLGSVALRLYRSAMKLTAAESLALAGALRFLGSSTGIGLVITTVAAAALGIKTLVDRERGAAEAAEKLNQAHADLADILQQTDDDITTLSIQYGDYDTRIKAAIKRSLEFADSLYKIRLQTSGLLGEAPAPTISFIDPDADAKAAQDATDKAFKIEADAIAEFNTWQRAEWERAAAERTAAFIASSDRIIKDLEVLKERQVDFFLSFKTGLDDMNIGVGDWSQTITTAMLGFKTGLDDMNIGLKEGDLGFVTFDRNAKEAATGFAKAWDEALLTVGQGFGDLFADVISGAKTFGDALSQIINQVLNSLFSYIGTELFHVIFPGIPKKAGGGPMAAFEPAIVGDRGPELWVPRTAGDIIPNHEFGGTTNVFNIDARGAQRGVSTEIRRAIAEMGDQTLRASAAKVADEHARGGVFRSRFRR